MAFSYGRELFSDMAPECIRDTEWGQDLCRSRTYCKTITYHHGEAIPVASHEGLGVLLKGSIEISDQRRLQDDDKLAKNYLSYRPIRLMKPGEFFNDFDILDRIMNIIPPSIENGERWNLFAGRHSLIVTADLMHIGRFKDSGTLLVQPDVFLSSPKKPGATIAYVSTDDPILARPGPFFDEFIRQCWKKLGAYRIGHNSYNLKILLGFRRLSDLAWNALEYTKKWKRIEYRDKRDGKLKIKSCPAVQKSAKTTILPIFSDALLDAIWRPVRGDPVFAHCPDVMRELDTSNIPRGKHGYFLVAALPTDCPGPFYYPIDLHNLEINFHCGGMGEALTAIDVFRSDRSSSRDGLRSRDFYIDLANDCLRRYLESEPLANYEYDVKCVDREGLVGRMLLLEFKRKPQVH